MKKTPKKTEIGAVSPLERLHRADPFSAGAAVLMAVYGIFVIASAVHGAEGMKFILIQILACVLGIAGMIAMTVLDYESVLKKLHLPIFLFCLALLALTLLIGSGEGSNLSWIRFKTIPIGIQPSEFAKLFFIGTMGYHLSVVRERINRIRTVIGLCLHFGVVCGLVLLQGDLGSALVFVFIFLCMLFAAGIRIRYYLIAILLSLGASPFLWDRLSEYQKQRILVGFSPESDPHGFGYQVLRAKEAISNGGLFGMGYMNGTLSQSEVASTLPKRHTDMIFAVLAEELGFIGVCLYLALFVFLVLRILQIARASRGYLGSYLCVGAVAVLVFQGLENMGMCMGLLPVIGLTLPFISYGGSSELSLFLLIGLVESVAAHRKKYYTERGDAL